MVRTITKEGAESFSDVLGVLAQEDEAIIVESNGQRVAVVITPEEYDELSRAKFWETVRQVQERNADKDPDEVYEIVTSIVEEVRQELYEEWLKSQGRRSGPSLTRT